MVFPGRIIESFHLFKASSEEAGVVVQGLRGGLVTEQTGHRNDGRARLDGERRRGGSCAG
jgi:hypothetical protein